MAGRRSAPDPTGKPPDLVALGAGHRGAGQALPAPAHAPGSCVITASGRSVICMVVPGWPFGRPGLRLDLPRSDRGAGLASPSEDGGFDEFRGFWASRARSASISARSASTWARSTTTSASLASITCRSRVLAARSAATSSGAGGTSGTNHAGSPPPQSDQLATPGRAHKITGSAPAHGQPP
jgi:hypothetical protein